MNTITFNLSDEHLDLLCRKLGYTPMIKVNTGEIVDGNAITIEKPISRQDFVFNYYAGVMDGDATVQKQREATQSALASIPSITLEAPQEAKLPELSADEIAAAVKMATPKTQSTATADSLK